MAPSNDNGEPKEIANQIFDSFGFADRVWKESNHMLEVQRSIRS